MKLISCIIFSCFIILPCLETEAQVSKTSSRTTDIKATFSRFFEYDESDTSQIAPKLALAKKICETDSASSYCQYAAAWATIIGNNEQSETALKAIEKLERDQPEWAEPYFLHAQYLYYKKEPGYIEKAQKSIELNPNLIRPVFFLAVSYYEAQNYKLSLVYYDKLEKLNPTHWSLYYNRGNVKDRLADYTGSIADYTKALELQPGHYRAMFNRGHAYLVLENYAKAEPDFDAFIKMMPNYARAYYYRGFSRYYLGNKKACCEDMQKAASLGDKESASFVTKYCQ
jgi:tetratricopeptide (TPR) repeat protein